MRSIFHILDSLQKSLNKYSELHDPVIEPLHKAGKAKKEGDAVNLESILKMRNKTAQAESLKSSKFSDDDISAILNHKKLDDVLEHVAQNSAFKPKHWAQYMDTPNNSSATIEGAKIDKLLQASVRNNPSEYRKEVLKNPGLLKGFSEHLKGTLENGDVLKLLTDNREYSRHQVEGLASHLKKTNAPAHVVAELVKRKEHSVAKALDQQEFLADPAVRDHAFNLPNEQLENFLHHIEPHMSENERIKHYSKFDELGLLSRISSSLSEVAAKKVIDQYLSQDSKPIPHPLLRRAEGSISNPLQIFTHNLKHTTAEDSPELSTEAQLLQTPEDRQKAIEMLWQSPKHDIPRSLLGDITHDQWKEPGIINKIDIKDLFGDDSVPKEALEQHKDTIHKRMADTNINNLNLYTLQRPNTPEWAIQSYIDGQNDDNEKQKAIKRLISHPNFPDQHLHAVAASDDPAQRALVATSPKANEQLKSIGIKDKNKDVRNEWYKNHQLTPEQLNLAVQDRASSNLQTLLEHQHSLAPEHIDTLYSKTGNIDTLLHKNSSADQLNQVVDSYVNNKNGNSGTYGDTRSRDKILSHPKMNTQILDKLLTSENGSYLPIDHVDSHLITPELAAKHHKQHSNLTSFLGRNDALSHLRSEDSGLRRSALQELDEKHKFSVEELQSIPNKTKVRDFIADQLSDDQFNDRNVDYVSNEVGKRYARAKQGDHSDKDDPALNQIIRKLGEKKEFLSESQLTKAQHAAKQLHELALHHGYSNRGLESTALVSPEEQLDILKKMPHTSISQMDEATEDAIDRIGLSDVKSHRDNIHLHLYQRFKNDPELRKLNLFSESGVPQSVTKQLIDMHSPEELDSVVSNNGDNDDEYKHPLLDIIRKRILYADSIPAEHHDLFFRKVLPHPDESGSHLYLSQLMGHPDVTLDDLYHYEEKHQDLLHHRDLKEKLKQNISKKYLFEKQDTSRFENAGHIEASPVTEKLKHLKGLVQTSGPINKASLDNSTKQSLPGQIFDGQGRITEQSIDKFLLSAPKAKFAYSLGHWEADSSQMHDPNTPQTVLQINLTDDHLKRIKEAGLSKHFEELHKLSDSGGSHPTAPHSIGWVRIDESHPDHHHYDEIQSDHHSVANRLFSRDETSDREKEVMERLGETDPQVAHKKFKQVNSIIAHPFKDLQHALHAAAHEYSRAKGAKSTSMDTLPDQMKQSGQNVDKEPPRHMVNTYKEQPIKDGYTESPKKDIMPNSSPRKGQQVQFRKLVKSLHKSLNDLSGMPVIIEGVGSDNTTNQAENINQNAQMHLLLSQLVGLISMMLEKFVYTEQPTKIETEATKTRDGEDVQNPPIKSELSLPEQIEIAAKHTATNFLKDGTMCLLLHRKGELNDSLTKENKLKLTKETEWAVEEGVPMLQQINSESALKGTMPAYSCWIPVSHIAQVFNCGDDPQASTENPISPVFKSPMKNHLIIKVLPGEFEVYERQN